MAVVDGLEIKEEPLSLFERDAKALFAEHCKAVGEADTGFLGKNWDLIRRLDEMGCWQIVTARLNGRMFGYLVCLLAPSIESAETTTATQMTFFVSQDAKGMHLGSKLQKAAIEAAKRRGATEVYMRAGVRGSGPKMGALYKRFGAQPFGELYKLELAGAA
jgi:GNAT superfamily N-acetyltransferase